MDSAGIPLKALLPIVVITVVFVGYCWYDIFRKAEVRYMPKWAWALICASSVPLGGIIYLLVGRKNDT